MQTNVTPEAALCLILEKIVPLSTEILPHESVLNRVLARNIVAPFDLPPFDNSAMDGYALLFSDLETLPARLELLEIVGAGEVASQNLKNGQTIKIMTGAPLPKGADCVVMHEETRADGNFVEFSAPAKRGQNIRRQGDDVRQNEVVLEAGTAIGAAQWAMLASLGIENIEVFRRPRVAIVATGAELVSLSQKLGAGQIYDSNSFALRALAQDCDAEIVAVRRVGDKLEEVAAVLREVAPLADVVVTSGGVSAGDFDPIRDVLKAEGEIHFWKIAMKPGKPVMFADFSGKPIFGLPGNPVSVMVAFEEFVRPALLKMGGRRAWKRLEIEAVLDAPLCSPPGKTEFVRASVKLQNGIWSAQTTGDQNSGRLSTMTRANALLEIAPEITRLESGQTVKARLLNPLEE